MGNLNLWNTVLWQWALPLMLTAAALVCAIRLRGRPVRGFGRLLCTAAKTLTGSDAASAEQRRISAGALAAVMGTGNLVGTAFALISGGAGAVFWMWVSAMLGMVLVYAENLLGMRWKTHCCNGTVGGGTFAMLREGLGSSAAAAAFAVFCAAAGLGMGNLAQSSTIAQMAAGFGISPAAVGLTTALLVLSVLRGGQRRIGDVSARLMPLISLLYLLGCTVLLIRHRHAIPNAILRIFREAAGFRAVGGGWAASSLMRSLSVGLRRGIFSNEAGLGTSALLHMQAGNPSGRAQGEWAATEVFVDTVLCCTLTALVILSAPCGIIAESGAELLLAAFRSGLGRFAGGFLAVCMVLLAFATLIGWYPCGASAVRFLFGKQGEQVYFLFYILFAFAGAFGGSAWVWAVCDLCNGLMAVPNLCGLLCLSQRLPECEAADEPRGSSSGEF